MSRLKQMQALLREEAILLIKASIATGDYPPGSENNEETIRAHMFVVLGTLQMMIEGEQ